MARAVSFAQSGNDYRQSKDTRIARTYQTQPTLFEANSHFFTSRNIFICGLHRGVQTERTGSSGTDYFGAWTHRYRRFSPPYVGHFGSRFYFRRSFWRLTSRSRMLDETPYVVMCPGAKIRALAFLRRNCQGRDAVGRSNQHTSVATLCLIVLRILPPNWALVNDRVL